MTMHADSKSAATTHRAPGATTNSTIANPENAGNAENDAASSVLATAMGALLLTTTFRTPHSEVTRGLRLMPDGTYRVTTLLRLPAGSFYRDLDQDFGKDFKAAYELATRKEY